MEPIRIFSERLVNAAPSLLFGLLILLVGYLTARTAGAVVRRVLARSGIDRRVGELLGLAPPRGPERMTAVSSRVAFWLVMLFALIGFFSQIGLPLVADPLREVVQTVVRAAPRLLEAGLILVVAWIVAALLRLVTTRVAARLDLSHRLSGYVRIEETEATTLPERLGTVVFYLVLLAALPLFLDALGQSAVVAPLVEILSVVLAYLPNVVAAGLTIGVGWVVARLVRETLRHVLAGTGLDASVERMGLGPEAVGGLRPSQFVASIAYVVVWIPFIVAGLDTLKIAAVSGPAVAALTTLLNWVPKGLGAAIVVVLAVLVSRFVGSLVTQLLRGIGVDGWPARLGLGPTPDLVQGRTWPELGGLVVATLVLLFAVVEAFEVMGLQRLAQFGDRLVAFAVNVLIAGAIVAAGLWVGGHVQGLLRDGLARAGVRRPDLGGLAGRWLVGAFAGAMALQQIGFGQTIVVTAFTLLFGAICLTLALAFGLGGRDSARALIERALEEADSPGDGRLAEAGRIRREEGRS